jgi:hypothetical protein
MIEMKKIIAGLLIALLAIVGIGIGYKINQVDDSKEETSVTVLQVDYPQYNTAEELVESSDLVFTGTVKNIEYQMIDVSTGEGPDEDTGFVDNEEIPYTLYTIDVDKICKGSVDSSTIIVKRAGGNFGDEEYVVENASEISKGKNYLFVTKIYEDTYPSLLNADQSSYDMDVPQTAMEGEEIMLSDILKLFKNNER